MYVQNAVHFNLLIHNWTSWTWYNMYALSVGMPLFQAVPQAYEKGWQPEKKILFLCTIYIFVIVWLNINFSVVRNCFYVRSTAWYVYQMVTQHILRTGEGKQDFSRMNFLFTTALDLIKIRWTISIPTHPLLLSCHC